MAAHGGHTRASGGRTVKMNVHVRLPLINSRCELGERLAVHLLGGQRSFHSHLAVFTP